MTSEQTGGTVEQEILDCEDVEACTHCIKEVFAGLERRGYKVITAAAHEELTAAFVLQEIRGGRGVVVPIQGEQLGRTQ